jgi:hypothetical protein
MVCLMSIAMFDDQKVQVFMTNTLCPICVSNIGLTIYSPGPKLGETCETNNKGKTGSNSPPSNLLLWFWYLSCWVFALWPEPSCHPFCWSSPQAQLWGRIWTMYLGAYLPRAYIVESPKKWQVLIGKIMIILWIIAGTRRPAEQMRSAGWFLSEDPQNQRSLRWMVIHIFKNTHIYMYT